MKTRYTVTFKGFCGLSDLHFSRQPQSVCWDVPDSLSISGDVESLKEMLEAIAAAGLRMHKIATELLEEGEKTK